MARRKRVLDDADSDSSASPDNDNLGFEHDPDLREEQELFEDPYKRKRRRHGKESAVYGVFVDDSENEEEYKPGSRKTHWTRAPAFVSSEKKVDLEQVDKDVTMVDESARHSASQEEEGKEGKDEDGKSYSGDAVEVQEYSDDSEPSRSPSSRMRLEDEDDYGQEETLKPRIGGIGSKPASEVPGTPEYQFGGGLGARSGIGARVGIGARGGIGTKGGIGSKASGDIGAPEETERVSRYSFSKGGIGAAKSLSSFGFTSSSTLKTVSLSEDNDSSPSLAPTPTPAAQREDSQPSSSRASPIPTLDGIPTAFGRTQGHMSSNRFKAKAFVPPPKFTKLSAHEMAHFSKISGSFGSRMLEKMGWQAGTGLGPTGEGIVAPVESKLRPQRAGIAFKGFREKTEQSKREAKRRGEVVSDDEEDEKTKKMRRKMKESEQKRSDVWKKPKKPKVKVEHKTYEQIVAEAGQEPGAIDIGKIIDATGAVPREVSSLAEVSLSWAPTSDPTRIPEIRHNVRLIAEGCKSDLDNIAREARLLHTRKSFTTSEETRLRRKLEDEAQLISRFQQIQIVANDISNLSTELASVYEVSLESFSPLVHRLVDQFPTEFEKYGLDEIVIAAVAPLVRRMVTDWDPLKNPKELNSVFRDWRKALKIRGGEQESEGRDSVNGAASPPPELLLPMTPFECLLWNVWLPKVRSAINNEWSPEEPQPAVELYEVWSTFLPPFIRDNILDQLILPKVHKAILDWNPKQSRTSLRSIVFPWLPFVGLRLEVLMNDARRKIKNILRNWVAGEGIPDDLSAWRDVHNKGEWDSITLKYVVPKLCGNLRTNFRIDPRNQTPYMPALQQTFDWLPLIRPSIFSQIFETEFFPEWLRILHIWLIQPNASYQEVQRWYQDWRKMFPEDLSGGYSGIRRGFTRGLELMNEAMELGPDAVSNLKKPDFKKELAMLAEETKRKASLASRVPGATVNANATRASRTQEITFKSIVEEYAATHDLLLMPTGKAHAKSRMPLYRVSPGVEGGKKGLLVYVLDDAVWASADKSGPGSEEDEFRVISLDEMISRAAGDGIGGGV